MKTFKHLFDKVHHRQSSKMASPFAVVICHGSYHTPEPYQPFLDALKSKGIEGYCPQLPTSDLTKLDVGDPENPDFERDPPAAGLPQPADDVKTIQAVLKNLIKDGKKVVLIGHSSGGFAATASATPDVQAKNLKAGGVIGIFFVSAFVIPLNESVDSFFQPKDGSPPVIPPYCKFHKHGVAGLVSTNEGAKYFFNGLEEAKAKYYESKLTASTVFRTVLENDAYAALPCTYLVTEEDVALPAAYQEGMVALQNQRPGVDIRIVRAPTGHSPHLSWTDGLVTEVQSFGKIVLG